MISGEKGLKAYGTWYSQTVTNPSTNQARRDMAVSILEAVTLPLYSPKLK